MRALALELSDAGLLALADGEPRPAPPSPGVALADAGGRILVGDEAARQERLRPRHASSRFWDELDVAALGPPFPEGLSNADLAHAHLAALRQQLAPGAGEVLLALPGWRPERQLGLVLGIARAAGFPVAGLVDAAVAAAASLEAVPPRSVHVDLQLHRAVVTSLEAGEEVVRGRVESSERVGLAALREAWVARIGEAFVRETRFDPLHFAGSEQALHDGLPRWLEQLAREPSVALALPHGGRLYEIALARASLVAWAEPLYEELAQRIGLLKRAGEPTTLLLSARVAALPGLPERLSAIASSEPSPLPLEAAAAGALRCRDRIRAAGEALPFVKRLPVRSLAAPPARAAFAPARRRPTHLLHRDVAHALGPQPFVLGTAIPEGSRGLNLTGATAGVSRAHCRLWLAEGQALLEDHSSYGSFVNGERVQGRAVVEAGDRLRVGGIELLLIAVEGGHGAPQD